MPFIRQLKEEDYGGHLQGDGVELCKNEKQPVIGMPAFSRGEGENQYCDGGNFDDYPGTAPLARAGIVNWRMDGRPTTIK